MARNHQAQANNWCNDTRGMYVDVVDETIVYVCPQHVMISREDWDKIQTRLMRTTTERNHRNETATGNAEKQVCGSNGEQ